MATSFGCNPPAAVRAAVELAAMRQDAANVAQLNSGSSVTGSDRIDAALHAFFADSTQSRQNLEQLLDRAAGMLHGLATGSTDLDRNLATALTPGRTTVAGSGGSH